MPNDQVVTPRHLLKTQLLLDRAGNGRFLRDLKIFEPDLANYLIESLSQFHSLMMALGGSAKRTQQTYQRIESCFLICLYAQHAAHRELWERELPAEAESSQRPPDSLDVGNVLPSPKPNADTNLLSLPDDVLAAATSCPLCARPYQAAADPRVIDNTRCERLLRCFACGAVWSLIYTLSDFRSLPTRPAE